jgi:hypothetical protein
VSGIQRAVTAFFATVLVALGVILVVAPEIYGVAGSPVLAAAFFIAVSLLVATGTLGVVRRWRWLFWVILVAFLAGALRLIVSALELAGTIPLEGPRWYVALQGAIGVVQLAIGLAMLASYRRSGIWGRAATASTAARERPPAS